MIESKKFELFDFYGIPYGFFDMCKEEGEPLTEMENDRELARNLIINEQPISKELEIRLLKYKEKEI